MAMTRTLLHRQGAYLLVCDIVRVLGVPLDVQHAGVFGLDTVLETVRIECGADGLGNL